MSTFNGRKFYDEHLVYLASKDTDALVEHHYAEDGALITFDSTIKGQAQLKAYFKRYLETLGYIKLLSTDKFTETDDAIFFEATVETRLGVVTVYDAFVLNKDGRATHHFAGVK